MEYKIDKGIPCPPRTGGNSSSGRPQKYPMETMQVGDSFHFGEYSSREMIKANNAVKRFNRKTDQKFSCRKVDFNGKLEKDGKFYIRVWRVS